MFTNVEELDLTPISIPVRLQSGYVRFNKFSFHKSLFEVLGKTPKCAVAIVDELREQVNKFITTMKYIVS